MAALKPGARRSAAPPRPAAPKPVAAGPVAHLPVPWTDTAIVIAGVLVALLLRDHGAFRIPFINDDYMFLEGTRGRSVLDVWGLQHLAFHWWRPWSRELHYLLMQRIAGTNVASYHAANFALLSVALAIYYRLAAGMLGRKRAAFATTAVAGLSGLALPVLWIAGVQELWMLVWALAALLAWRSNRVAGATAAFALALLSKETAATLPAFFLAMDVALERRTWPSALRRVAPALALEALWALAHPRLGGRLFHPLPVDLDAVASPPSVADRIVRTLLTNVNLDKFPAPASDLGPWWAWALASAAVLGGVVWLVTRPRAGEPAGGPPPAPRVAAFAAAWAVFGWLPLLLPGLGWQAYYAVWGSFGAWLAIAAIANWDRAAVVGIVVVLAGIGVARDATPSQDWGDAYYQRRAGNLLLQVRALVETAIGRPAPHSRFYFWQMPDRIGFLYGDGPAIRVWYGDSTLRAGLLSTWRPRAAGDTGPDRFFRLDGDRLNEVLVGDEDGARALADDPAWASRHGELAVTFARANDMVAAAREYEKLARAQPRNAEPAYNAWACWNAAGDTLAARPWQLEALRRPLVSEQVRQAMRASGLAP